MSDDGMTCGSCGAENPPGGLKWLQSMDIDICGPCLSRDLGPERRRCDACGSDSFLRGMVEIGYETLNPWICGPCADHHREVTRLRDRIEHLEERLQVERRARIRAEERASMGGMRA